MSLSVFIEEKEGIIDMNETNKKLETKRILIYLGITFFITYAFSFCVIYPLRETHDKRKIDELLQN